MVGLTRLELVTPRLSSVCSNQLSYGPIPRDSKSNQAKPKFDRQYRTIVRRRSSGALAERSTEGANSA